MTWQWWQMNGKRLQYITTIMPGREFFFSLYVTNVCFQADYIQPTTNATLDIKTAGGDNDEDKWEVTRKRGRWWWGQWLETHLCLELQVCFFFLRCFYSTNNLFTIRPCKNDNCHQHQLMPPPPSPITHAPPSQQPPPQIPLPALVLW